MADGKVKIVVDTNAKEVTSDMKKLEKSLHDVKGTSDTGAVSANKLEKSMSGLERAVTKLVRSYLGLKGIKVVFNYLNQSVEAFRQEDVAIKQLNQTLMNTGNYSAQYSQHIQQLANEFQNFTNYGNEAVIKAVAIGQAFSGTNKMTDGLIKATVDFASAMDMDLNSAFTLVGKSIGSQTNALGRYGVSLDKNMTETQKMAEIEKQLGETFGGTAKNTQNATKQMINDLGELAKAIGRLLNPAFEKSERKIAEWAKNAANAIDYVRRSLYNTQQAINSKDMKALQQKAFNIQQEIDRAKTPNWLYSDPEKQRANLIKYLENDLKKVEDAQKKLIAEQNKLEAESQGKSFKLKDDVDVGSIGSGSSTAVRKVKEVQNAYQQLQKQVNDARTAVQITAVTYGTSSEKVAQAFAKYKSLNEQLSAVDNIFDENKTSAQLLQDKITELTHQLEELYLSGQGDTDLFKQTKNSLSELQTKLRDMNTALTNQLGIDWGNTAKSIRSELASAITTPLREGETAFERLGNVALNIVQQIGQKAIESLLEEIALQQVLNGLKAAGKAISGFFGGFFPSANGNVFQNGNLIPFASGGVVNSPTMFPLNNGVGLMGEAGSEAIMPLKRGKNGDLGVQATQPNINIYNQSPNKIETVQRPNGDMDIFIKRVNEAISNERTSSGFRSAFNRQSNYGVQAV